MTINARLELSVIEQCVCDVVSEKLCIPRNEVLPSSRLVEDLQCDSLDIMDLIVTLEDDFLATIPTDLANPIGKSIFIRQPFRLSDLAEVVYLYQGTGSPERKRRQRIGASEAYGTTMPFCQLSGHWNAGSGDQARSLFEPLGSVNGIPQFRRRSDGMRCLLLPSGETTIGSNDSDAQQDEQPVHTIRLDSFLIDAEPVSTTAWCRFLNSVEGSGSELHEWFQLDSTDDRVAQMPVGLMDDGWRPVAGTETLPMVLVSWFGANAYSLWANGSDWSRYDTEKGFLPSEAEWEYAARGAFHEPSPDSSDGTRFVFGQHDHGTRYSAKTMRMAPVHLPLGVSSFGLYHMAGNVWQWCQDWFANDFYQRPDACEANPINVVETGVRSERGGSWVGPIELCRTTYRRGRVPNARGRCLGFRCISPVDLLQS